MSELNDDSELDRILTAHNVYFWKQDGKTVHLSDKTLRDNFKAAIHQRDEDSLTKVKEMLEVQGQNGNWNVDGYMHGMYNGMELALAILEDREPKYRAAPDKWIGWESTKGLTTPEKGNSNE